MIGWNTHEAMIVALSWLTVPSFAPKYRDGIKPPSETFTADNIPVSFQKDMVTTRSCFNMFCKGKYNAMFQNTNSSRTHSHNTSRAISSTIQLNAQHILFIMAASWCHSDVNQLPERHLRHHVFSSITSCPAAAIHLPASLCCPGSSNSQQLPGSMSGRIIRQLVRLQHADR